MVRETLEELVHQVHIELADQAARVLHVVLEARSPGKVDHHPGECLVERHVGMAVTHDAGLVADGARAGLAEDDADVFHRMVRIDVQVAPGIDLQIQHAVARYLVEHVLEERDTGGEARDAGAVEIHAHADLRLFRIAGDLGRAHIRALPSAR